MPADPVPTPFCPPGPPVPNGEPPPEPAMKATDKTAHTPPPPLAPVSAMGGAPVQPPPTPPGATAPPTTAVVLPPPPPPPMQLTFTGAPMLLVPPVPPPPPAAVPAVPPRPIVIVMPVDAAIPVKYPSAYPPAPPPPPAAATPFAPPPPPPPPTIRYWYTVLAVEFAGVVNEPLAVNGVTTNGNAGPSCPARNPVVTATVGCCGVLISHDGFRRIDGPEYRDSLIAPATFGSPRGNTPGAATPSRTSRKSWSG